MYTQNYNKSQNKIQVVTFPNQGSIKQMQILDAKEQATNSKTPNNTEKKNETSADTLLLFSILAIITDSKDINTDLFSLIAGVVLSL